MPLFRLQSNVAQLAGYALSLGDYVAFARPWVSWLPCRSQRQPSNYCRGGDHVAIDHGEQIGRPHSELWAQLEYDRDAIEAR